jgi:energy-coupling factor transporter transmembrane protein EcfT
MTSILVLRLNPTMTNNKQIYLLTLLLLVTVILTTRFFAFGMMGLTTFVLAYLSKGIRRNNTKINK